MSVTALHDTVTATVGVEPSSLGDEALRRELIEVRAEIDRLEVQFARLAHAAHSRGVGAADGSPSTAAWLRRHTGQREGDARAALDAGAASEVLAETGEAWRDGAISAGAARTILGARVAGHDLELIAVESILVDLAHDGVTRELQRACAHFRACATADGTSPRDHDGLTLSATDRGRTLLHADLSSDAAEKVATAIHALTDPPADTDLRTAARRRADALVRMAEIALAHLPGVESRVARPSCTVVIDWAALTGTGPGRLDGQFTGSLHRRDVERLLCDSAISRVVTGPDGLPLDAGRATRTIPAATRRALAVRDGGCRFPGCRRPPGWCEAHHVVEWRNGGPTDLVNLVFFCDHHHHLVHQPGWIVKFDGQDLRVVTPDGTELVE